MSNTPIASAYKFCPHCGAANPQPGCVPYKCSDCGFVSFFGPVAAVGALIINQAGALLLVRRARDPGKGKWGLPGGFVDAGESVENGLLREISEETGLSVTKPEYLFSYPNQYNYCGIVAPVIDLFYLCQVTSRAKVTIAPDELDHFEWTKPTAQHLDNMAFLSNRLAVEHWLSSTSS